MYFYDYYSLSAKVDLNFRWTKVVEHCKKGFKYYAKDKDMPVIDPRFLPSNRTNDPDVIARYLGVTIKSNFASMQTELSHEKITQKWLLSTTWNTVCPRK